MASSAWPSATSVVDSPRCQKRIVSSSRLAPRAQAGDDLPELGVQRLARERGPGRRGGAARRTGPAPAWPQSSTTTLSMIVGQRELDRAHRAVGHDERARARSTRCAAAARARAGGWPRRRRRRRARSRLPVLGDGDRAAEVGLEALRRTPRGSPAGASGRGSRRGRGGGRAGARSSRRCRARRCGPAPARRAGRGGVAPSAVTAPVRISVIAGGVDDRHAAPGPRVEQVEQRRTRTAGPAR